MKKVIVTIIIIVVLVAVIFGALVLRELGHFIDVCRGSD